MHNKLSPKDYTAMKEEVWDCLCIKCHKEKEMEIKNDTTR